MVLILVPINGICKDVTGNSFVIFVVPEDVFEIIPMPDIGGI